MRKKEKNKTPILEVNKEKQLQAMKILMYTSSSNQGTVLISNLQEKKLVLRPSSPDATMVATKNSEDACA